jgi:hypothetical protein
MSWKRTKKPEVERIRQFLLIAIGYYKNSRYIRITLKFKEEILSKLIQGIDEGLIEVGDQCPLTFEVITDIINYRLIISIKLQKIVNRIKLIADKIPIIEKMVYRCDWILKYGLKHRTKLWKHDKIIAVRNFYKRIRKHLEMVNK